MLAILFLFGSALLGLGLVRRATRDLLDLVEQVLWGVVIGWVLAALTVYLIARWHGELTFRLGLLATLAIWIILAILISLELRHKRFAFPSSRELAPYAGLGVLLVLLAPIYWRMLSVQVFAPGPGGIYAGSAGNDLNFHAALITSFVYGQNLPPTYTLLPPQPLFYPYLPDFHAAILMVCGLSLRSTLIITAMLLGAVIAGLFYCFALRIARAPAVATLATLLFLLNGGLGFAYFIRDWWQSHQSTIEFWNTLTINYGNYSERGLHWTNIVADMMIPQRTSLFGLSLGLIVFTIFAELWRRWHDESHSERTPRVKPLSSWALTIIAGVLAGILPLVHTHTYIAVGLVSLILFILRPRREWLFFWATAIVWSAPQLLTLITHAKGGGIVRPFFGWLGHDDPFFPLYLLRNFGIPLLLAIPAWWIAPRSWRRFYLAFLVLLLVGFTVVYSPNLFDNGKIFYYWHALNSVLVGSWLIRLATRYRQRLLMVSLAILSIATALIVFHTTTVGKKRIFTDEELAAAAFIRDQTSPRALFLTAPALNSPALSLAGRRVVRGAAPWIWSHGYEFRARENDVRRIYAGTVDALDLVRYYNVDYIYLGDAERSDVKAGATFFDANFPAVYRSQTITVYDARQLRDRNPYPTMPMDVASRLDRDPYSLIDGFPDTSFFVYRLFKASYGRMPRRDEFISAMTVLGSGLSHPSSVWDTQLQKNRETLLRDWATYKEFQQVYGGKSNAELLDTLLKNAGLNWSAGRRDDLVRKLSTQTVTLQTALLSVIEDREFYAREYNNAYVLMHFFGYLRRNPDDAPDFDLKGFNFWRDRLNSWGDYRTISLAFMESEEYRNMKLAP